MNDNQTFQTPFQLNLLKVHKVVDAVFEWCARPIRAILDPNTGIFQRELDRKPLKSVK
jgi:hypothetical protein